MSIIKSIRKVLFVLKINFYKINKSFHDSENYDKYLAKKLVIKSIPLEKIIDGVLTISIPKDAKSKIYNIMLVTE